MASHRIRRSLKKWSLTPFKARLSTLLVGHMRLHYRVRLMAWHYLGLGNPKTLRGLALAETAKAVIRAAQRNDSSSRAQISKLIERFVTRLPLEPRQGLRSVILTGYPRSGKSILARELQKHHNYIHLELDELKRLYYEIDDADLRLMTRKSVLDQLLSHFPEGLVIEGDDLISENRSTTEGMLPFSLNLLKTLGLRHGILCYVVGNVNVTLQEKIRALEVFRETGKCWTTAHPRWHDPEIFGKEYIEHNREIHDMARHCGIAFIELNPKEFDAAVKETVRKISRDACSREGVTPHGVAASVPES
jgi:hypothetical protein